MVGQCNFHRKMCQLETTLLRFVMTSNSHGMTRGCVFLNSQSTNEAKHSGSLTWFIIILFFGIRRFCLSVTTAAHFESILVQLSTCIFLVQMYLFLTVGTFALQCQLLFVFSVCLGRNRFPVRGFVASRQSICTTR